MTGRWSRSAARDRWDELGGMLQVGLSAGVAVMALWPLTALVLHWSEYHDPPVAGAIFVFAVGIPLFLCWQGPRGIGPFVSLLAGGSSAVLTLLLGLQLDGTDPGGQHWMNSWGVASAFVLAFARPVAEPLAIMTGVLIANFAVKPIGDAQALHIAPMTIGAAVPPAVAGVVLAAMLRRAVRAVRETRASTEAADQRRAVAEAVHEQRRTRFAHWESAVAPLLDDIATGRKSPDDPSVAARCAELSERLRVELSAQPESLFDALLEPDMARLERCGGRLIVRDLDMGHRLREEDRVALVGAVREVCGLDQPAAVQLALLDGDEQQALVIMAVEGVPVPDSPQWRAATRRTAATMTAESPTRWWWDATLQCQSPALRGVHTLGR